MDIIEYTVEKLKDPTGILTGDRYEYYLTIEVDEEDELFSDQGINLRVIYAIDENGSRIAQYHFIENNTNKILDFELEEDELEMVHTFCKEHIDE